MEHDYSKSNRRPYARNFRQTNRNKHGKKRERGQKKARARVRKVRRERYQECSQKPPASRETQADQCDRREKENRPDDAEQLAACRELVGNLSIGNSVGVCQ